MHLLLKTLKTNDTREAYRDDHSFYMEKTLICDTYVFLTQ